MKESDDQLWQIIDSIPALTWSARPDGSADFFNVHSPLVVVPDRVYAKSDHLGATFGKVALQVRYRAELGCTHRRKVFRMREKDCPIVADPFMEVNCAMSRFCSEIRSNIVDAE